VNIGTAEVIERGMSCLSAHLGAQATELFIATILRERFDYTKWRRNLVDEIKTCDDFDKLSERVKEKSHFSGTPDIVL